MACDSESTEKLNFMSHKWKEEEKSFLVLHLSGSFVISTSSSEIFASEFNLNSCKVHAKLYDDEELLQKKYWVL